MVSMPNSHPDSAVKLRTGQSNGDGEEVPRFATHVWAPVAGSGGIKGDEQCNVILG